jgi:hypothetical protein
VSDVSILKLLCLAGVSFRSEMLFRVSVAVLSILACLGTCIGEHVQKKLAHNIWEFLWTF